MTEPARPQQPSTSAKITGWFRHRWKATAVATATFLLGLLIGSAGNSSTPSSSSSPPPPPISQGEDFLGTDEPPPAPEPPPAAIPDPNAEYDSQCAYVLGNFTESRRGFRFIGSADVTNTGNIGVVVRVRGTWAQLGTRPLELKRTVKVARGRTRTVPLTLIGTQDQIDLHQSADGKCKVGVKIVDTFGKPVG